MDILVIDDTQADLYLIKEMLSQATNPLNLDFANSYSEGLNQLTHKRYDVILCDYFLDCCKTGAELIVNKIPTINKQTPCVVISSLPFDGMEGIISEAGAIYFVDKNRMTAASLETSIYYASKAMDCVSDDLPREMKTKRIELAKAINFMLEL